MGASLSRGDHAARLGELRAPTALRQTLSRRQRLADPALFQEAFAAEAAYLGPLLIMRLRTGPGANLRLGVVAGKRTFPRSVDRSRVKRLMREAFRLNRARLRGACDVILIARGAMLRASRQDVEADLLKQARKARMLAVEARETDDGQGSAGPAN